MFGKLFMMLTGFCQIKIHSEYTIIAYNILRDKEIYFWDVKNEGEYISFFIEKKDTKLFLQESKCASFDVCISSPFGLPKIFSKYKKRYGIYAGFAAAVAILWMSTFFVWDIRVAGNERISDDEIISLLEDSDFHIGTYIPSVDFPLLHNEFLLNCNEISWIAVNLNGTVANVEVREKIGKAEPIKNEKAPANMVADCAGEIVLAEVFEGISTVVPGDIVEEGDLLISGMIDSDKIGIRYEQADGKVLAKISKHISVNIPLSNVKKVYTGDSTCKITLNFFSKNINIFSNSGNYSTTYDKIIRKRQIVFGDTVTLPVYITEEILNEYKMEPITINADEAAIIALAELQSKINDALEHAELLEKEITATLTEDAYTINCELYCLQDIAVSAPFEIHYSNEKLQK